MENLIKNTIENFNNQERIINQGRYQDPLHILNHFSVHNRDDESHSKLWVIKRSNYYLCLSNNPEETKYWNELENRINNNFLNQLITELQTLTNDAIEIQRVSPYMTYIYNNEECFSLTITEADNTFHIYYNQFSL